MIQVIDNGSGVPAAYARRLFRPGFTTKKRGWGLGLTLARRIVQEYHKGKIFLVRSRPGETVFQITLPMQSATKSKPA
jgi:two-component system, sporulation sensor kinase D